MMYNDETHFFLCNRLTTTHQPSMQPFLLVAVAHAFLEPYNMVLPEWHCWGKGILLLLLCACDCMPNCIYTVGFHVYIVHIQSGTYCYKILPTW